MSQRNNKLKGLHNNQPQPQNSHISIYSNTKESYSDFLGAEENDKEAVKRREFHYNDTETPSPHLLLGRFF